MEISSVKSKLNSNVKYKGSEYLFTACILRKNKDGELFYQAEIKDTRANSVIICKMNDIE